MIKRLLLLCVGIMPALTMMAQPALYEVSLDERIEMSSLIVEGQVIEQRSFWNAEKTLIYTANVIDVYRVFKGDAVDQIELVTPGGRIGFTINRVDPSLKLKPGMTGLFFAEGARVIPDDPALKTSSLFQPYASVQGFIRYDEVQGKAADVFRVYPDIASDLYDPISAKAGRAPEVMKSYAPPKPAGPAKSSVLVPSITSFSPAVLSAGTGTMLTINGSGFEAYDGGTTSKVFFPNADDGGATLIPAPASEIVSWTASTITLRVPNGAGTGNFLVQSASGGQGFSGTALTVDFNQINVEFSNSFLETNLQDKNGTGGYSFMMSTNTSNNGVDFSSGPGVGAFESALLSWRDATGYNVFNNGGNTSSNTVDANTDPDIVMFDNDANPLASGVLGQAFSGFTSCDGATWAVSGFDVVFRRNDTGGISWNFGPGSTGALFFDFESVAVHELGHTHQLDHIIAPGNVMHFQLTNGADVRTLSADSDIAGGTFVLDHSASLNICGGSITGMKSLIATAIEDETTISDAPALLSEVYPNPFHDRARFDLSLNRPETVVANVYDLLGREVRTLFAGRLAPLEKHAFTIDALGLPAGVYVLRVDGETFHLSRKMVLLPE